MSVAESPARRLSARRPSHIGLCGPDNRLCRVWSRPWNKMVTWNRTPPGLETAAPCQPRAALAAEGSEKRWNFPSLKIPALHREAERDTTGSFNRQPPVHTWIEAPVQGKRRSAATLRLIRRKSVKLRLTLWFYCGKTAARRHGFVGEPRKSSCFAGMRAGVRCSIAVSRDRRGRRGSG